ncbi:MAG: hypothetical protein ACP5U1_14165, partial [Desulfomonilaceae bacterium]
MKIQRPRMLLVCLCLFTLIFTANAMAWNFVQASASNDCRESLLVPVSSNSKPIMKIKPQKIAKIKPSMGFERSAVAAMNQVPPIALPAMKTKGWELDAQAFFARTKGNAIYLNGQYGFNFVANTQPVTDFNSALGIPDHVVLGSFTAKYRFHPRWSLTYSIIPAMIQGGGNGLSPFQFGTGIMSTGTGQAVKSKWDRLYQQMGLVYDPIRTQTSRVGIFAEYVRLNERVSVLQGWGGAGQGISRFDNDLNMAMVGIEMEKLLRVTRHSNTLSVECKAGVAFCDNAVGSDMSTGLKYSVPLNNGRSGFVKGGY